MENYIARAKDTVLGSLSCEKVFAPRHAEELASEVKRQLTSHARLSRITLPEEEDSEQYSHPYTEVKLTSYASLYGIKLNVSKHFDCEEGKLFISPFSWHNKCSLHIETDYDVSDEVFTTLACYINDKLNDFAETYKRVTLRELIKEFPNDLLGNPEICEELGQLICDIQRYIIVIENGWAAIPPLK